ncbi:MAG TPA: alpha/beta hydrolase [Phycisphaerae bacterium]|nr:alpha/beta hydrolase [Phycisphaerae bacterium]
MVIEIDNLALHCEVFGEGEPVLFIHGFPLSGEMWRGAAEALSDRWRCLVPDLRGHGRSAASAAASMARYADDLAAMLDKLREWRPVVVVGLSMGGYIAFEFYRRHRARVRAMVLCDTRAEADAPDGAAKREAMAQEVLKNGSRAAADVMVDKLFAPGVSPQLRQHWHDAMSRNPPVGVAAAARALATRPDSTSTLTTIDCPTLFVVGREDTLTPPAPMEAMARAIRGARLEIIEGAGHMPPVEQPGEFNRILRGFLESL